MTMMKERGESERREKGREGWLLCESSQNWPNLCLQRKLSLPKPLVLLITSTNAVRAEFFTAHLPANPLIPSVPSHLWQYDYHDQREREKEREREREGGGGKNRYHPFANMFVNCFVGSLPRSQLYTNLRHCMELVKLQNQIFIQAGRCFEVCGLP